MSKAGPDIEKDSGASQESNSSHKDESKTVQFAEGDPDNPLNWSAPKRWTIVGVVCFASCATTCCSSMITSCYAEMQAEFGVSHEVVTLGITLFVAGLGVGPLLLGPLSEFIGRRPIYVVSFFIFTLFNVPVAVGKNMATILTFRFLSGLASAAFLSVAGGTVTDLFQPSKVMLPMSIYTASPFIGPALGPIIAGFITVYAGWRWVFYVMIIWAGVNWGLLALFTPETYAPKILKLRAARLRKETGDQSYQCAMDQDTRSVVRVVLVSCYKPFELVLLEPMALFLNLWTSLLLGILYAFFSVFPIVFTAKGFSTPMLGLSFVGILLGNVAGPIVQLYFTKIFFKKARELGRPPDPEEHLRRGIVGGILAPIGILGFAFTTYPHVHWILPILFSVPFAVGTFLVYSAVFTYLVATFRPVAASALASNSFMRASFAAAFPLFSVQAVNAMHPQYACLLYGLLVAVLAPLPVILFKNGHKYRKSSKFSTPS